MVLPLLCSIMSICTTGSLIPPVNGHVIMPVTCGKLFAECLHSFCKSERDSRTYTLKPLKFLLIVFIDCLGTLDDRPGPFMML